MNTIDRIINSQEHTFIALRSNGSVALTLIGLAILTITVLPSILA